MAKVDEQRSREPNADVKFWLEELAAAKKREKDFRKDGKKLLAIYDGEKSKTTPFNILFSNTETMLPALYSAVPRPVVQRRFKDEDPLGQHASLAGQRGLEFLLDTNLDEYDTFDSGMKAVTLDALLPGRGWVTVKYDATMGEYPAQAGETAPSPYTESELICIESQQWDRVYHGYAKKWAKVPWVAYEQYIDKEEATEKFGAKIAAKLRYSDADESDKDEPRDKEERSRGERKTACLYQIWDKAGWGRQGKKKILYLSPGYKDGYLKIDNDELQLSGFFNCPRPLQFVDKTHSLTPTALYTIYENQAAELNKIQQRINRLVEACKVRGLYDGSLGGDLSKLFTADENDLIPTDNASSLATEKGLANAIWMMPLGEIRQVLMDLYSARESCKQVIYEITGLSDILRGASKASETLGAQEIKTQWGTLRLKNKQKEVARYARDLLRMLLELAASKLSEDTWAKMTGLPFTTQQQVEQAQMILQAAQMNGMEPDPQAMALLQQPTWQQVLGLLRNDLSRSYRIDIETNSTVEPEATEDHKNITELLQALGMYLQGVGPLVVNGTMPFEAAQAFCLAIARRFRFGNEIEDYLKQMKPPTPPGENGAEQVQKEKEMASKELELQKKGAESDLKMKSMEAEMQHKQREMDLQMREMQLAVDQDALQMERQAAQQELSLKSQGETQKLQTQQKMAQMENTKFKTENMVNQKADSTLGKGIGAMQDLVKQLVGAVAKQSTDNQRMIETLVKTMNAPRKKQAIRGKDGRIEAVEETVAA